MKIKLLFLTLSILLGTLGLSAQQRVSDTTISTVLFQASYAMQFPGGDLTEYFGYNSTIGGIISYKTNRNWLWNAQANFIFGDQVKNREQLLALISTSDGEVIDGNGTYTSLALYERGYHVQFKVGKLIPVLGPNPNSGFYLMSGVGYLAHRIHIETQFGTAPQLMDDYALGYDHMRGGFAYSLETGYMLMSNKKIMNFSLGFEFIQAFTHSLRDYNFDLMMSDGKKYTDNYYGIRINWIFPAFNRAPQKYYYN